MIQDYYAFCAINEICLNLSQLPEPLSLLNTFGLVPDSIYYILAYYFPNWDGQKYTKQLDLIKKFETDTFLTPTVVNQKIEDGVTPLIHLASKKYSFVHYIALILIAKGADVNEADNNGVTPLFAAALHGNWPFVMALLLSKKVKTPHASPTNGPHKGKSLFNIVLEPFKTIPDDTPFRGRTIHENILPLLLENYDGLRSLGKLSLDDLDPGLLRLLNLAVSQLRDKFVWLFRALIMQHLPLSIEYRNVESGVSLQFYNHHFNFTKKRMAAFTCLLEIEDLFLFAANKTTHRNKTQIKKTVLGDTNFLANPLLGNKSDTLIDLRDKFGNSLLHLACQGGNIDLIDHLIPEMSLGVREDYEESGRPEDEIIKKLFCLRSISELYKFNRTMLVEVNANNETALDIVALNIARLKNEIAHKEKSKNQKCETTSLRKKSQRSSPKHKDSDLLDLELNLKQQYKIRNVLMNVIQPNFDRFIFRLLQHLHFKATGTARNIILWKIIDFLGPFPGLSPGDRFARTTAGESLLSQGLDYLNPDGTKSGALNSRQIYHAVFRVQNETHQAIQRFKEYTDKIGISLATKTDRNARLDLFFETIKQNVFSIDKENSDKLKQTTSNIRFRSFDELMALSDKANLEKKRWREFSGTLWNKFDEMMELCENEENRTIHLFALKKGQNPAHVLEAFAARKFEKSAKPKIKISKTTGKNSKISKVDLKPVKNSLQDTLKSSRTDPFYKDSIEKLKYNAIDSLRLTEIKFDTLVFAIRSENWPLFEKALLQGGLILLNQIPTFSRTMLDLIFEMLEKVKDNEESESSIEEDYPPLSWHRSLKLLLELIAAKELLSIKKRAAVSAVDASGAVEKVLQKKTKFTSELFNLLINRDNSKLKLAITFISSGIPLDLNITNKRNNGDISTKVFSKKFIKEHDNDIYFDSFENWSYESQLGDIFFKAAQAFECIRAARSEDFKFTHPLQRDLEGNPLIHLVCKHLDDRCLRKILSSPALPRQSYSPAVQAKSDEDANAPLKPSEHEASLYPLFCRDQQGRTPLDIITLDILALREELDQLKITLRNSITHQNYQKNWDEQDILRSKILSKEHKKGIILNKLQPYVDRFVFKLLSNSSPKPLSIDILWDIMQLIDIFPGAKGLTFETVIVNSIMNPTLHEMLKKAFNSKAIRKAANRALLQEYLFQSNFIIYFKELRYNSEALMYFYAKQNFFSPQLENLRIFNRIFTDYHLLTQVYEKESKHKQDLMRSKAILFSARKSPHEEDVFEKTGNTTNQSPEPAQSALKKLRLSIYCSTAIASILHPEEHDETENLSFGHSNPIKDDFDSLLPFDFLKDDEDENELQREEMGAIGNLMQTDAEEDEIVTKAEIEKNKENEVLKRVFF